MSAAEAAASYVVSAADALARVEADNVLEVQLIEARELRPEDGTVGCSSAERLSCAEGAGVGGADGDAEPAELAGEADKKRPWLDLARRFAC